MKIRSVVFEFIADRQTDRRGGGLCFIICIDYIITVPRHNIPLFVGPANHQMGPKVHNCAEKCEKLTTQFSSEMWSALVSQPLLAFQSDTARTEGTQIPYDFDLAPIPYTCRKFLPDQDKTCTSFCSMGSEHYILRRPTMVQRQSHYPVFCGLRFEPKKGRIRKITRTRRESGTEPQLLVHVPNTPGLNPK